MDFVKNSARYIIGFFVVIVLIVILVVLLLGGRGDNTDQSGETPEQVVLEDYSSTDTTVRLTLDGPVTAQQNHDKVVITVGRANTTLSVEQGYDGNVVRTEVFPNTEDSYNVFLQSINKAGYTVGNDSEELRDERGFCPTGKRYIFEVVEASQSIQRFWTTSCGGDERTFDGRTSLIIRLFKSQVPDYGSLARGTGL